jgi:glycosyltransferase involved in cell wall biosynthesis
VEKKRILVLNNYSVARVTSEINRGVKPAHHLYGILELAREGHELIVIDRDKNAFWDKIGSILNKIPLFTFGDLYQQVVAFKRRKEYDIVYAPCQTVTQYLGFLKFFGFYNKKIVAIAHHPFLIGRLSFFRKIGFFITLRGHYKWGALSSVVANEINSITKQKNAECFHWGPDLHFFDSVSANYPVILSEKTIDVISIGRTGRDYQVLIDAYSGTDISLEIYCSKRVSQSLSKDYTQNIKIVDFDAEESLNYIDIIKLYQRAKIMAVPMFANKSLAGLTSLTDAIALGMPIMITANNYIEIDVEKEGIGCWIEIGNSKEWREKTVKMLNEQNLKSMGLNSRRVAQEKYNTDIFLNELISVLA